MPTESSNAYGGGARGKYRKKPSRRLRTTPYDRRRPRSLRNTPENNDNASDGGSGCWLSRIVDPASKLISGGAHKLFSSVFRKRLLLPPPQSPTEEEAQPSENHLGNVKLFNCVLILSDEKAQASEIHLGNGDPAWIRERGVNEGNNQINGSVTNGVVELENILRQKTFTRSERDRLTALLHSRTVDKTGISGKREFEVTEKPSEPSSGHSRQGGFDRTAHEDDFNLSEVPRTYLTPAFRLNVNDDDDDFASLAELPKAYMGSRSSKESSHVLGLQNQAAREETPAFSSFQLHRPTCSTLQKPFSTAGTSQHDFGIPRSHGRSAICNKTRTPYFKGSGIRNDASDGDSLSSQKELSSSGLNHEKEVQGEKFRKGSLVEVSSDEDGYQGAWFAATVVQVLKKGKYLIEYLELRTDDDTEFMKEEVDGLHITPPPPKTDMIDRFRLYEKVDALHNDGWWVGVIFEVLANSKYLVYFKESNEELKFSHDELRPHQDWIDGKWVTTSEVLEYSDLRIKESSFPRLSTLAHESIGVGLSALDS